MFQARILMVVVAALSLAENAGAQSSNKGSLRAEHDQKMTHLREMQFETAKGLVGGSLLYMGTKEEIAALAKISSIRQESIGLQRKLNAAVTPDEKAKLLEAIAKRSDELAVEMEALESFLIKKYGGLRYPQGSAFADFMRDVKHEGNKIIYDSEVVKARPVLNEQQRKELIEKMAAGDREAEQIWQANKNRLSALSPKAKIVKVFSAGAGALFLVDALGHGYIWMQKKNVLPVGQSSDAQNKASH